MESNDDFALALQNHRARNFPHAEHLYRQLLERCPDHVDANHGLGMLLNQTNRNIEAAERLRQAVAIAPQNAALRAHLANVLLDIGQTADAAIEYRAVLSLAPNDARAWNNLGSVQASQRQMIDAEASFREAIRLNPSYFQALFNLANALAEPGRYGEAAEFCRRALDLRPDDEPSRYLLAALTGVDRPPTAPRSYVTPMFESYANSFDDQLLRELRYRGPAMLRDAVDDVPGSKNLDILDLGCGTGLCGREFADLARSLIGVDLSERMLQRAQSHGIYNTLFQGELLGVLRSSISQFDLILAADVFIYVGDLAEVFAGAGAALRPGGRFVFVVEDHDGDDFVLRPSRRFAHSPQYIRTLAERTGFSEVKASRGVLRVEHGREIFGATYVLRSGGG